jgi:protein arginine kinase activator
MQCEICHEKEATVHLTEIVNNKVTKLHICEQCAREKSASMEAHFGLADLLSGLADLAPLSPEEAFVDTAKCPSCKFTFQDFRRMGRLGCPRCYETFKEQLKPLMRKIHGSDRHIGKTPRKKRIVKDAAALLADLKARLSSAIKLEEFEEAARIRDRIRVLESGKKKGQNDKF